MNKVNVASFRHTLAPGETRKIAREGRYIRGMDSGAAYEIRIGDGAPVKFQTGIGFDVPGGFDGFEIINSAGVSQTIEVMVADGAISDNRLVGQLSLDGAIVQRSPGLVSAASITATTAEAQLLAAAPGRSSATVQNIGANDVYVGVAGTVVAAGIVIPAGGAATLTNTAVLHCATSSGVSELRVLDEQHAGIV